MSILKKPNGKNIANAGITVVAMVAGAKISDGVATLVPESVGPYKGYILGALGIIGAACISGTTTAAQAAQGALLGMGAQQIYNEVTETAKTSVAARVGTTSTDKFVNALVGHGVKGLGEPGYNYYEPQYLAAPWEASPEMAGYDQPMLDTSSAM